MQGDNPLYIHTPDEAGTMPGMMVPMPMSWWWVTEDFRWQATGAVGPQGGAIFDATWYTPTFDLRPEFRRTDNVVNAGVMINRSPALGAGTFLRLLVIGQPAFFGDTSFFIRAEGHVHTYQPLYRLMEETDITTSIRGGGYTVGGTVGASPYASAPPAEGLRFWRVIIRASQEVLGGGQPRPYSIAAAVS